jgi:hypothetical protein
MANHTYENRGGTSPVMLSSMNNSHFDPDQRFKDPELQKIYELEMKNYELMK